MSDYGFFSDKAAGIVHMSFDLNWYIKINCTTLSYVSFFVYNSSTCVAGRGRKHVDGHHPDPPSSYEISTVCVRPPQSHFQGFH